jgi:nitrite reductase/ring-hydroxylating ferredoxin subunit
MVRAFPFPLPNGWFQIAYAEDVARGAVVPLRYFGRHLVLFRTAGGVAHAMDAFCPHRGAHLGYGGTVDGETIRCPMHGWCFDGGGACRAIPNATAIPPEARVKPWPTVERAGIVWAWHHAGGDAPAWDVPRIEEAESDAWIGTARFRWTIRTRNQEMGENAVDRAHFRFVHGTVTVPDSDVRIDGVVRRAVQRAKLATPRGVVDGEIESTAYGLGCAITRFRGICDTVLIGSTTPIDDETVDSRFTFLQKKIDGAAPRGGVAAAILRDIVKQVNEDIPIWENKIYRARPLLCDGDGAIGPYRRWASQFYSRASPSDAQPEPG